ncbi:MAG: exodeoxyribonuclease 7 large subunit [Cyclobacteriaceae bacterium]|nr:MAG: exodeoxyribonuclease 7 large subunit [Cyclobacteriaceae bacterium]
MQQVTLYQLNKIIQATLDQNLDGDYWVAAEIGELRVNQKGHCYMELVEKDGQKLKAKLRANIWAYDFYNLNSLFRQVTGRPLNAGMKILARVVVQFHELYGLSLHVRDLDPNYTLGERARHRQQVIDRLGAEGIIHSNKQISLPLVPQRVAVISSATAAGYGDFIDQLVGNQFGYTFKVKLFDTTMQGEEAISSLIGSFKKIEQSRESFDLVALIRGGGSQVDFDCFDNYQVARAITACPLPVITGIGHQRDDTIADMVAHSKMKTPTAVAEFLINGMGAFDQQLNYLYDQIKGQVNRHINDQHTRLFGMLKNLGYSSKNVISESRARLDMLNQRLSAGAGTVLKNSWNKMQQYQQSLAREPGRFLSKEQQKLQLLETKLNLADPVNVLKRGYSITYANGSVLKENQEVDTGEELTTYLYSKTIRSSVTEVKNERTKDL